MGLGFTTSGRLDEHSRDDSARSRKPKSVTLATLSPSCRSRARTGVALQYPQRTHSRCNKVLLSKKHLASALSIGSAQVVRIRGLGAATPKPRFYAMTLSPWHV